LEAAEQDKKRIAVVIEAAGPAAAGRADVTPLIRYCWTVTRL